MLWEHQDFMFHFTGQLVEAEGKTHGLVAQEPDEKPSHGPPLYFRGYVYLF